MEWTPTGTGHELTIRDGAIIARNDKGKELASVPAKAKKSQAFDDLDALLSFLHQHDLEAGAEVERWLLRSLPVPRAVLAEVWADEAWRSWLTDLVVATDDGVAGFLRSADASGLGVVDLDGESVTLTAERVLLAHPALLEDLDDLREFSVELGITQRLDQLFREVHRKPADLDPTTTMLNDWSGGEFAELRFATGRARAAGFKVSGGYATCVCFEEGEPVTARYWIGADYPEAETVTGDLHWTVADQVVPVAEVGPLAYSEGVRMAAHIFAGRTVAKEEDQ
ncbi:MAG: DUF4132 domain-containing protein [Propionibacteriaceae bacterium]|nr:DUF4132 domain-containing protein [Propionibacteriaceae bacterium]